MATALYGTVKYGEATYGGQAYAFDVRVEHWHAAQMIQRLDPVLRDGGWEYLRFGGCGQGTFTLSLAYECAGEFRSDDEIRVYCRDTAGPNYSLFYRGLVCQVEPAIGVKDSITVTTMGYRLYLDRIPVDATYDDTEVSLIVRDVLDTVVCPNSAITYDSADINTTGFTPDSITFLCSAAEALDMLAKLGGMMEYGVDRDGKFFFRTPSTTVAFRFPLEKDVVESRDVYNWEEIVNRVIVRGADTVKRTRNDTTSQAKYGIRAKIVHNTSATTNTVADEYGDAILADQSDYKPSGSLTLAANRVLIEATRPLRLVTRMKDRVLYGQVTYGDGSHYQALYQYRIARINYRVSEIGLTTSLELGMLRPRLADYIFQLNSNLRAARPT
jgi:hypothetical protein